MIRVRDAYETLRVGVRMAVFDEEVIMPFNERPSLWVLVPFF